MLLAAEAWRKEFGVDEIVKSVTRFLGPFFSSSYLVARNFEFKEKVQVDKYYPQFYHKTDKVGLLFHILTIPSI
jgi:hypothetical protein